MEQLIKNYRENGKWRRSFNELAQKTFGIDFEDWYQNGYWTHKYIPYSMVVEGQVVANVSVNITPVLMNGERKQFIQLGTVMTDEKYRNRGLIRKIMEEIDRDYSDSIDGMYLFAGEDVLDFYPKFNFKKAAEFTYEKAVCIQQEQTMQPVPMQCKADWNALEQVVNKGITYSRFEVINNNELLMFYVTKYNQSDVYYDSHLATYAIAEVEDRELFIHNIFSEEEVCMDAIIEAFGKDIKRVKLGFTPKETQGYNVKKLEKQDTTLHLKGIDITAFEQEKVMFPTLAHA